RPTFGGHESGAKHKRGDPRVIPTYDFYNLDGNVTESIDGRGKDTFYGYDAAQRLVTTEDQGDDQLGRWLRGRCGHYARAIASKRPYIIAWPLILTRGTRTIPP